MAEAQATTSIVQQIMNQPTVFLAGAAAGYVVSWFQNRNKNQGMGFN